MKSSTITLLCSALLVGAAGILPLSADSTPDARNVSSNYTEAEVLARMDSIRVADFRMTEVPLSAALAHLDGITEDHGVQILFRQNADRDPVIGLATRHLTLSQNLTYMCRQAGYNWSVQSGVIVVAVDGFDEPMVTEMTPVKRPTVDRLAAAGLL